MRTCCGCTKCCEGWLRGEAHGEHFWPGRPCKFCMTGKGCEIYEARPDKPCKSFKCAWIADDALPAWMKPSECGAIVLVKELKGHHYLEVVEAGQRLDVKVLSWLIVAKESGMFQNLSYMVDGGKVWIGTPEFIKAVEG